MKTLPTFAFLAALVALVAFVVLPFNFEVGGSMLFAAGFAAIMLNDYRRANRPLMLPMMTAAVVTTSRKERFGLAA